MIAIVWHFGTVNTLMLWALLPAVLFAIIGAWSVAHYDGPKNENKVSFLTGMAAFICLCLAAIGAIWIAIDTNDLKHLNRLQEAYPNRIILDASSNTVKFINEKGNEAPRDDLICDAEWQARGSYIAIFNAECQEVEDKD